MKHVTSSVILAVLLALASSTAALAEPWGPGGGWQAGVLKPVSFDQVSALTPTTADLYVEAVLSPSAPLDGVLEASYSNGTLTASGDLTVQLPEANATINATISSQVQGSFSYVADEGKTYEWRSFNVTLYIYVDSESGVMEVSSNITGSTEGEGVVGNYSYSHTSFGGPVHVLQSGSSGFEAAFDLSGDVYTNTTIGEDEALSHTWGSVIIDFNTGDPFQDAMYASMLAQIISSIVAQYGLQENVTVTANPSQGIVEVDLEFYVGSEVITGPVMGGFGAWNASILQPPVSLEEDVNVTYSAGFNLNANASTIEASFEVMATGIPEDLVPINSFTVQASVSHYEESNTTALAANVSVDGLDSPVSAFYPLVMLAKLGLSNFLDAKVVFVGSDGVAYKVDSQELTEVVVTSENKSLIDDLRLVYNGTEYGFGDNGEILVEGPEGGEVEIPITAFTSNQSKVVVKGPFKVKINAGSGVTATAGNLPVEIENPMGHFKVNFSHVVFNGSLTLQTLDPAQASSLLPASFQGTVVGPALSVSGVVSGGGEVEIPLIETPQDPGLVRVHPNGTVEVIENATVEDGVLKAVVPGFSTLIPVDLAAGQPGGGSNTTTTTTTSSGSQSTTTTPATTTTPPQTTYTTTPATTTTTAPPTTTTTTSTTQPKTTTTSPPAPTSTTTSTTTPAASVTTTTTQQTTGQETTTTTQTATTTTTTGGGGQGTSESTTPATGTTTPASTGGVRGSLIAATVVILVLAGAAVYLLRR